MKRKFIVVSSKEGAQEGSFYTKIQRTTSTVFGDKVAEAYNVKGTKLMTQGEELEIDFNVFEGREYESTFANTNGEMVTRKVKWLHVKGVA